MNLIRLKRYFLRFLGKNVYPSIDEYKKLGIKIGNNCDIIKSTIDISFPKLLEIGNDVTITHATILVHDASTYKKIGYTKFGKVIIGDNVFIGANAVILPNVRIGNDSIIGAGCIVTKDVPNNSVVIGNPMRIISSTSDYLKKFNEIKKIDSLPNNMNENTLKECIEYINERNICLLK